MAALDSLRAFVRRHKWWQNAIFFAGLVSVITVFSVTFLGADSAPQVVWTNEPLSPVSSPQFAESLSHLVNAPLERGGRVDVLDNGDGFLPALLRDIRGADATINIVVYAWKDGRMSDQVLDALIERQRQGVEVRVLLDGMGGEGAPADRFEVLRKAGGRVSWYREASLGTWTRLHRRNHRRSIVIDGEVGYVGGMGIADQWLGHAQDADHWRDMMFRVTGPMARRLQAAFVGSWVSSSGEIVVQPPAVANAGREEFGVERFIHHVNSPADDDRSMAYFYLLPILAARQSIYLTTPYFIPDAPLKQALLDKARAGVDVRLLVPGEQTDHAVTRLTGQNAYEDLLAAGVRIYEYGPTFIHSKVAIVDGRWCIIGSPNLNARSRRLDEENALAILDRVLGAQLEQRFFADVARSSALDLGEWQRRGPLLRLMQLSARLIEQQS
jgi:cardiolipin synthase A/B